MSDVRPDPPWSRGWPPVSYWMKVAGGVVVVVLLANLVAAVQNVLVLVLVSVVLSIGFQPAVDALTRRGLPRGLAVALIVGAGLLVVAGFLAVVLPIVIREVGELVREAPAYLARVRQGSGFVADLESQFDLSGRLREAAGILPTTVFALVRSFTTTLFNVLTVLILTVYFTAAMPRIRRGVAALLLPQHREGFEGILGESVQRVGGYVLGQATVSAIAGAVSFVALSAIGVPYPAALAFWVALTDLVPTIGAILGALAAVLVAAFAGVPELVATALFFLVYQQVENYVIAPRVMKRAIDISAPAVIVAVLVGGSLAGFVGALLALPVTAILKIAVRELYLERRLEAIRAADAGGAGDEGEAGPSSGRVGDAAPGGAGQAGPTEVSGAPVGASPQSPPAPPRDGAGGAG